MTTDKKTIILVHSAWHGGWYWKKIIQPLTELGFKVYTPTLTGLGERSHLASEGVGLHTHIEDIRQVMNYEDLENVYLLGHGYGGMVVTGAADQLPQKVKRLIYLDAFVPENGNSAFDYMPYAKETLVGAAKKNRLDWLIPPMPPQEFGITDPEDLVWVKERLCQTPLYTHEQKIALENPLLKNIPVSYIFCKKYDMFGDFAKKAKDSGWDYHEINEPHDVMITNPEILIEVLAKIG